MAKKTNNTLNPLPDGPSAKPVAPSTDIVAPSLAVWQLVWIVIGAWVALLLTFALPQNRYLRWQQSQGSILFHSKWIYDRIHFDPTPIDVAVVGTSRLEASVSPILLQDDLSRKLSRPVHVANLSLLKPGRDIAYLFVKQLLTDHPEAKVIILSIDEDSPDSHPLFQYIAEPSDLLDAPRLFNFSYVENVAYIPYRNIALGIQTMFPGIFGVQKEFSKSSYIGTNLDRTLGYTQPDGTKVYGLRNEPTPVLIKNAEVIEAVHEHEFHLGSIDLRNLLGRDRALPIDRDYTRKIARLAQAHGAHVVFLEIRSFGGSYGATDPNFYRQFGPVLRPEFIFDRPDLYSDGPHLDRKGAVLVTHWLSYYVSPILKATDQQSALK